LEEEEPVTITTSIEALHDTQDKVAATLLRICDSVEARIDK